jgi:hypothetical protein
MRLYFLSALAVVLALAGCSATSGSSVSDSGTSACATDPRVTAYSAGMQANGAMGLHVVLASSDPAPPSKGDNQWVVELLDASNAPVDGATISVTPYMPDHGHGSSIIPTVTPMGGGKYEVDHVNLFMPGVWQVTFVVTTAATSDQAAFTLCIAE